MARARTYDTSKILTARADLCGFVSWIDARARQLLSKLPVIIAGIGHDSYQRRSELRFICINRGRYFRQTSRADAPGEKRHRCGNVQEDGYRWRGRGATHNGR